MLSHTRSLYPYFHKLRYVDAPLSFFLFIYFCFTAQRGGWDLDPFLVINYGSKTFRTRVIRHSLTPTWDEKLLFHVVRSDADTVDPTSPHPQHTTVHFKLLDWDKNTTDDIVGDAEYDFADLVVGAPMPDARTGLYPEETPESRNAMRDLKLPLVIAKDVGLESRHSPFLNVRWVSGFSIFFFLFLYSCSTISLYSFSTISLLFLCRLSMTNNLFLCLG